MENATQTSLKQIYQGVIIYITISIIGSIVTAIAAIMAIGAVVAGSGAGLGLAALLAMGVSGLTLFSLILYILGLMKFGPTLDTIGQNAIKKVFIGLCIIAFSCLLGLIPLIGMVAGIVTLAGFIVEIIGFSEFRNSQSLNEIGKTGAGKLFNAQILSVIAGVCMFIPIIGWIAAFVLNIVYWIFMIQGWGLVRKSFDSNEAQY